MGGIETAKKKSRIGQVSVGQVSGLPRFRIALPSDGYGRPSFPSLGSGCREAIEGNIEVQRVQVETGFDGEPSQGCCPLFRWHRQSFPFLDY